MKAFIYTSLLLLTSFLLFSVATHAQIITTIAGDSTSGYNGDNIPATTAKLNYPLGIALDGSGNLYISERYNNRIRKINTSGIITTIAGIGIAGFSGDDSEATIAKINAPLGIAVDVAGNIYFSDDYNQRVRKISASGIITTIAGTGTAGFNGDGSATAAQLNYPHGVAVDGIGNVYVADFYNNRIRKISPSGIITTIVGTGTGAYGGDNGPATAAEIYNPYEIALDAVGDLFIADFLNHRVRKVNPSDTITTVAGTSTGGYSGDGGPATNAVIGAVGVAIDVEGNVYIADASTNSVVRMVNTSGIINTIAGIDGFDGYNGDNIPATQAQVNEPTGVAVDAAGNVYIADFGNSRIRRISSTLFVQEINTENVLQVYPNPNDGRFILNIPFGISEPIEIVINDLFGRTIKTISAVTNEPQNIFLNDAPGGVYLLIATTPKSAWTKRIIVAK